MSHFLVYWKTFWDYDTDRARKHVLSKGYGTNARKFAVKDSLWIIATDRNDPNVWRLLQYLHIKETHGNRAIADYDGSLFFEEKKQINFENTLKKLQFHSGKSITKSNAQVGLQLQKPRQLSVEDIEILDKYVKKIFKKTIESENEPSLNFPDKTHRNKVEKASIFEATKHLKSMGYIVTDRQKDNCGYDLLAKRKKRPKELHVEVKGTSNEIPQFFISRNERNYMSNSNWRLLLVTNALDSPNVLFMTKKEVDMRYVFSPLAWQVNLR